MADAPIEKLFRLQECMDRLRTLREERERMPPEIAGLHSELATHTGAIADLEEGIGTAETERRELGRALDEANDRLARFQTQLMEVRTNKEYSAVLNEIDAARKEVLALEDRALAVDGTLEEDRADLARRRETLPAEEEAFESKATEWRAHQKRCDEEIATLEEKSQTLGEGVPKRLRRHFDRLLSRRDGTAVVRVVGPFCPGCNVRLRPALVQQLRTRSAHEMMTCESCQRILYCDAPGTAS